MVARLARLLHRGPRPRTADDDDWGTSSPNPTYPMDVVPSNIPERDLGVVEAHHEVMPKEDTRTVLEKLKAQELNTYTCTFSPRLVISVYFVIGLLFVTLGAAIIAGTRNIRSAGPFRYDDLENCNISRGFNGETTECELKLPMNYTIPAPSYLYYSLTNYHQNNRKYAKSRSDIMNQGKVPNVLLDAENCEPWLYRVDQEDRDEFRPEDLFYPCGLTARSFFNDSYILCQDGEGCETNPVKVRRKEISWWTDREHKFRRGESELFEQTTEGLFDSQTANDLLENEDFVVWMRLAAFPNFLKLYGVIEQPLLEGVNYKFKIVNRYPVESFGGSKSLFITTTEWFGDENTFLGTAYLVVGVVALFIATVLLVKHLLHPRPPAGSDPTIIMRELAKLNSEYRRTRPDS